MIILGGLHHRTTISIQIGFQIQAWLSFIRPDKILNIIEKIRLGVCGNMQILLRSLSFIAKSRIILIRVVGPERSRMGWDRLIIARGAN